MICAFTGSKSLEKENIVPIKGFVKGLSDWCCKKAGFMTARMKEVDVRSVNHSDFGDDHRGAVTGPQMGNN